MAGPTGGRSDDDNPASSLKSERAADRHVAIAVRESEKRASTGRRRWHVRAAPELLRLALTRCRWPLPTPALHVLDSNRDARARGTAQLRRMTLVVGELHRGELAVASDTEVTAPASHPVKPTYTGAALKTIVLHRALCVSYAGAIEGGARSILELEIHPDDAFDSREVVRSLRTTSQSLDVDYLVAALTPTPSLTRITGGLAYEVSQSFVGLPEAHSAYEEHLAKAADETALGRMQTALETVLEDETITGVGGFLVAVASDSEGFRYLPRAILASAQLTLPGGTPAGTYVMPLAGAAEGGYRFALLVPRYAGVCAIGIYFQPGDFGLLLDPRRSPNRAIEVRDVTQEEFVAAAREQYGHALEMGGRLNPIL
jgi:hypothetical protein